MKQWISFVVVRCNEGPVGEVRLTFCTLMLLELVHGEEGSTAGEHLVAYRGGVLGLLVVILGIVCCR